MPSMPCGSIRMDVLILIMRTIRRNFGVRTHIIFEKASASKQDMRDDIAISGEVLKINGCEQRSIITVAESSRASVKFAEKN